MAFSAPTDNTAIRETRDALINLTTEIKKANDASAKLNTSMLCLTVVTTAIALIELFTHVWPWLSQRFSK